MVRKVKCSRRSSALRETRRKWTEKLKRVSLDDFTRVCTIGEGGFAHVNLVQLTGHPKSTFALKTMQKAKIKRQSAQQWVLTERNLLGEVHSDFVVKLYRTFKDKKHLYLLTEYCPGGDLLGIGRMSEDGARFYIACMVEAIDALHSKNIVHNDLKPENLMLDAKGYVKLIDMGFASKVERDGFTCNAEGTVDFLPPEVIWSRLNPTEAPNGRDRAVDLWALGVILYELLRGQSPFCDEENSTTSMNNIMRGIDSVEFSAEYFSDEAEDLVRRLCSLYSRRRIGYESIEEIRQHPWFSHFSWEDLRQRKLPPPIVPKISSPVDTQNFNDFVTPDSDEEEDMSDWDRDF